jgi:hypothetical protein
MSCTIAPAPPPATETPPPPPPPTTSTLHVVFCGNMMALGPDADLNSKYFKGVPLIADGTCPSTPPCLMAGMTLLRHTSAPDRPSVPGGQVPHVAFELAPTSALTDPSGQDTHAPLELAPVAVP